LGYTFLKKDQGAFRSAADGVVIYAQNWKKLLMDAAKTTAVVVVLEVVIMLVSLLIFGVIFRMLGLDGIVGQIWGFLAFVFACFVAWLIKKAFIDSYMMVKMMVSYMEEAPRTVITFDLYTKLCGLSRKFKELFDKGQKEDPIPRSVQTAAPAMAAPTMQTPTMAARPSAPAAAAGGDRPVFCGECGARNARGTKFCGGCGKPI